MEGWTGWLGAPGLRRALDPLLRRTQDRPLRQAQDKLRQAQGRLCGRRDDGRARSGGGGMPGRGEGAEQAARDSGRARQGERQALEEGRQAGVGGQVQEEREQAGEAWGEAWREAGGGHGGCGGISYSDRVQNDVVEVKVFAGNGRRGLAAAVRGPLRWGHRPVGTGSGWRETAGAPR